MTLRLRHADRFNTDDQLAKWRQHDPESPGPDRLQQANMLEIYKIISAWPSHTVSKHFRAVEKELNFGAPWGEVWGRTAVKFYKNDEAMALLALLIAESRGLGAGTTVNELIEVMDVAAQTKFGNQFGIIR